eukprot:Skav210087  [mRNA]  locus=scaffold1510:207043:207624:+ [translate_table: standard]
MWVVLGAGLVPSTLQNSTRAEIWALVMAIAWLTEVGCDGVVHVDSQAACDDFWFLQTHLCIPSDWNNKDMWEILLQKLIMRTGTVTVRKVSAHMDPADATSEDQRFCSAWNQVADLNAKTARLTGGTNQFCECYEALVSVHRWQTHWSYRCQQFLLDLAQFSLNDSTVQLDAVFEPEDELVSHLAVQSPNTFE